MRTLWTLLAILILGGFAHARPADCLLIVNGRNNIDGTCDFRTDSIGFQITSISAALNFVQMDQSGQSKIFGYWSEEPINNHANSSIGSFRQDGACWVSNLAHVCAWKIEEPRTWAGQVQASKLPPYVRPGEYYGIVGCRMILK